MDDFGLQRRSLLISGLGASAVTGSSPLLPPASAERVAQGSPFPSVTDHGAIGDGTAGDAAAFQRALSGNAGGLVIAPARAGGYRLNAPVTMPPDTTLWFLGEGRQAVVRAHDGDLFVLQSGARIIGGNFDGGGRRGRGSGFLFAPGTGQQSLERIRATRGWRTPILRYVDDGGSQSQVTGFSLGCEPGDPRPFAVTMEAGSARGAAPRHFRSGDFNGAPSFDFDGCSVVTVNGVYCGPLRFTDTSRGVMLSDARVGNQPALEIRGSNHVLVAGWYPRLTLAPGADNCLVSGFFNSGYVRDLSGNARNLVDFWPHQVDPVAQAAGRSLRVGAPFQAAIARAGATYTYRFGLQLDLRQLGPGALELELPEAVSTSAATDQWGTGMLQMAGSTLWETLALRVLPKGERRAIAVFAGGHPLGARDGIARLSGTVSFSA